MPRTKKPTEPRRARAGNKTPPQVRASRKAASPPASTGRTRPAVAPARPRESLASLRAELKAARAFIARLEKAAHVDVLVDVLNRRGFERELRRAIAYVKRYGATAALLFGDVDGLKPINDRHGHQAGDRYLVALTNALAQNVRESDTLARIGGDEFALLLWNISEADAEAKATALEAAADGLRVAFGSRRLQAGLSLGVTMLRPQDHAADALDRADRAMYLRKSARKSAGRTRPARGAALRR